MPYLAGKKRGVRRPIIRKGYRMVWDAESGRYILEHRVIMQRYLGRKLNPSELVHHKDHNPLNNDLSNLPPRDGYDRLIANPTPELVQALLETAAFFATDVAEFNNRSVLAHVTFLRWLASNDLAA